MAMANTCLFRLLLISLCFSQIIIRSNAVPFTRIGRLMHRVHVHQEFNTNYTNTHLVAGEEERVVEREDLQVNDYPGSGANNRHTPRAQYGRCLDC